MIPFAPPVRRENVQYSYAELQKHTAIEIRDLVNYYKNTGGWDPETCEPHVVHAIEELYAVCANLARKIGVVDEQQPPSVG